jgi:glutamine amidotransferase
MCRHLAYLGPQASLQAVLTDPPHGLYRQSWASRRQRYGTVNADGFGVGWYADGDPVPARYRRALPIWADESFAYLARVTRTGALLAAVRSASPGTEHGPSSVAPFTGDGWLFSHNGRIEGWPSSAAAIAATLPAATLLELDARVDSALLWALVLHRLRGGLAPAEALSDTISALAAAGVPGRFNFLLTDGHRIAASAAGDSLCYRIDEESLIVASEPCDDEEGWVDVPDGKIIEVCDGRIDVR